MKIALAQINIVSGDVKTNIRKMTDYIEKAKEQENDVVVFPEMSDTGYDMSIILKKATNWNIGAIPMLKKAAKENSINVIVGVSKKTNKGILNGVAVINREGKLVYEYFKTHLITAEPMLEHHFLEAGNKLGIFELEGIKIGLMTCYEIRFPEISRSLSIQGAELIIIVAAWPLVRLPHWQNLSIARAIENQLYIAATDRIGNDTGLQFAGTSMLIGPYGNIISSGTQIYEELITGTIDKKSIQIVREQIKVHQDRRPELYK